MALPGTTLANSVLSHLFLKDRLSRYYTQVRAKDRTHKMYGGFTNRECERIVAELKRRGISSARASTGYGLAGVRFEMPKS